MNYYYAPDGQMALKEGYGFNEKDGYGNAFLDIVAIQNENNSIERKKAVDEMGNHFKPDEGTKDELA